jgi:uncharacterized protein YbbC (DUF1343 family)
MGSARHPAARRRPATLPTIAASAALLLLAAAGCRPAASAGDDAGRPAPRADRTGPVRAGIDVLLAEQGGPLAGKRVGLLTNQTGRTADGRSTIDALAALPRVRLVALFAPEHGIRGTAEPGETIESGRDRATGLPIFSLYGATRAPTPDMLKGLDAFVVDLQDVGARYYTYDWTTMLAMQAAARSGLDFYILDRPDPIGGARLQGNVLDPSYATLVGLYPVPMAFAMTVGELATYVNTEFHIGARLHVVRMQGWRHGLWYDHTGLPWTPPSPNMPDLESAASYPGTCLFEGTNLSVGRGTAHAFAQIGAPWLDGAELARRLNARRLAGVRFEPVTFTPVHPGDGMYPDTAVHGVRFRVTDRAAYDAPVAALAALLEVRALAPDRFRFSQPAHFDRLAGTGQLRQQILAGTDLAGLTADWPAQQQAFERARRKYLLYP